MKKQLEEAGFEVRLGRKNNLLLREPDLRLRLFDRVRERPRRSTPSVTWAERVPCGGRGAGDREADLLLDPYLEEMRDMEEEAEERQESARYSPSTRPWMRGSSAWSQASRRDRRCLGGRGG